MIPTGRPFLQHRKIALLYGHFKVYTGEWAWKAISDRLQKPCYLSRKLGAESKGQILENISL
jgi:hypothetical protein